MPTSRQGFGKSNCCVTAQIILFGAIILLTEKKHFRKVLDSRERRWSRHD